MKKRYVGMLLCVVLVVLSFCMPAAAYDAIETKTENGRSLTIMLSSAGAILAEDTSFVELLNHLLMVIQ